MENQGISKISHEKHRNEVHKNEKYSANIVNKTDFENTKILTNVKPDTKRFIKEARDGTQRLPASRKSTINKIIISY